MNPKEKALELCQKFGTTTMFTNCNDGYTLPLEIAKKCALIAVNEIIADCEYNHIEIHNSNWWHEVKSEIEKI
jgi:hypothetical protein